MDFYNRVGVICRQIPYGKVATYGQIALLCQKPRNARQVGYALNQKVDGEDIPAHRVVNHQGYLSGAGAFEHLDLQKKLLEGEAVEVSQEQRVDLKKYGWKTSLEDAYDFQRIFEENKI